MSRLLNESVVLMTEAKKLDNALADLEERVLALHYQFEQDFRKASLDYSPTSPKAVAAGAQAKLSRRFVNMVVNFRESLN